MIDFDEINIGSTQIDLHEGIQVALVNMPVSDRNVELSFLKKPNISRARLTALSSLLNDISVYRTDSNKKIDLVVFPEVSIPHSWEAMLVTWARRHNIGVIAGLEHWVDHKSMARNEVLAALPYSGPNSKIACIPIRRLKKFYSPEESFTLEGNYLKVPLTDHVRFELIRWRGASFAVYNCYELASLEHRGIFKGKVDFIIGTEFNRDTGYFSNIVESAARDIHCYVVQVNDSKFGDSRIVNPSRSATMNPVRIKGGDNLTFLTAYLNLGALRVHQGKRYGLQKNSDIFKATPPGMKIEDVLRRINLDKF